MRATSAQGYPGSIQSPVVAITESEESSMVRMGADTKKAQADKKRVFQLLRHFGDDAFWANMIRGSSVLPVGGFEELTFTLRAEAGGADRLPAAHTCTLQLDMPWYESKNGSGIEAASRNGRGRVRTCLRRPTSVQINENWSHGVYQGVGWT